MIINNIQNIQNIYTTCTCPQNNPRTSSLGEIKKFTKKDTRYNTSIWNVQCPQFA